MITLALFAAEFAVLSSSRGHLLYVGAFVLLLVVVFLVVPLIDRWVPAFGSLPDRVIGEEGTMSSTDLESETDLDSRWGYHVDLGGGTSEAPWAASPLEWEFSYVQDWVAKHAPLLLNEAGVIHTCEVKGNVVRVVIPRLRDSGFDVTIEAATFGVLVRTGILFHAHFRSATEWDDWDERDESEDDEFYDSSASRKPAEQALGLVRDLLSPAVRIRERRAAGIPYYAALEARVGGEWRRRRAVVPAPLSLLGHTRRTCLGECAS